MRRVEAKLPKEAELDRDEQQLIGVQPFKSRLHARLSVLILSLLPIILES